MMLITTSFQHINFEMSQTFQVQTKHIKFHIF